MNQLFDKYYEHPVDRIHDLGSTSVFQRREPSLGGMRQSQVVQQAVVSPRGQAFENQIDDSRTEINLKSINKKLKSRLQNLLWQKFSFVYVFVSIALIISVLIATRYFSKSISGSIDIDVHAYETKSEYDEGNTNSLRFAFDKCDTSFYENDSNYLKYECIKEYPSIRNETISFVGCQVTVFLKPNQSFQELEMSCENTGQCFINFRSPFSTRSLIITGNQIDVFATSLTAHSVKYTSVKGSFKAQRISASIVDISTRTGDVVLQTHQNTRLSSIQSEQKLACITAAHAVKILGSGMHEFKRITSINELFFKTTCGSNPTQMVSKQLEPAHKKSSKQQSELHLDCFELKDIIVSSETIPVDTISFSQTFSVHNELGNTYINVYDIEGKVSRPLKNDVYLNSKPQLSKETREFLNSTLNFESDQKMIKTIFKLNYEGRHPELFSPKEEIVILFNKEYQIIDPSFISTLSFNLIEFNVVSTELLVSPSICPYYMQVGRTDSLLESSSNNLEQKEQQQAKSQSERISQAIVMEIQEIIRGLGITTASISVNDVFIESADTQHDSFVSYMLALMVIGCFCASGFLSYLAYESFEHVRLTLRRKAFEIWTFLGMSLFQQARSFVDGSEMLVQSSKQRSELMESGGLSRGIVISQRSEIYPVFTHVISMLQSFVKAKRSSIESFCEILFVEQTYRNEQIGHSPTSLEYSDEIPFEKFREYYSVYCYAMNGLEEVIELGPGFLKLLDKYGYCLDGNYLRASSQAHGQFCIYRGLMEQFMAAICVDPMKYNMHAILDPAIVESLAIYRGYLVNRSVKLGKINAFSILENIAYYGFVILQLIMPFLLCLPMLYAQWSYSFAELKVSHGNNNLVGEEELHLKDQFEFAGFPRTVLFLTCVFVLICAIDSVHHFTKTRLDRNNLYLKDCYAERILDPKVLKEREEAITTAQKYLFKVMNTKKVYQIVFKYMLWMLILFNLFFFLLTSLALAVASFFYIEQGLLLAIFLLILIAVLIARYQSMKTTHLKARKVLENAWRTLINCDITQQYSMAKSMNNLTFGHFLKDKNMDDKYYRRNRYIACMKADVHYKASEKQLEKLEELMNLKEGEFQLIMKYLEARGVSLCLKYLRVSRSDIVRELAVQLCIQFGVFLLCSIFIDFFDLCKNGFLQLINAFMTILIAIIIFRVLDSRFLQVNPQALEDSVNYVSRIISRSGFTFFTQKMFVPQEKEESTDSEQSA